MAAAYDALIIVIFVMGSLLFAPDPTKKVALNDPLS
jgi:hypothetical protein